MARFTETLYDNYAQQLPIAEVFFENRTDHQHLLIFQTPRFGRVMALDGVVQTTEGDEFIYHEMLTHVPILAHGQVKHVLIIGGGDGGILREVVRHQAIERIVQVEIDDAVVQMSKQHLPNHSRGAYDDPRFELVIDDGARYLRQTSEQFEVIISDSTDPIGPGESLFTSDFYAMAKRCLAPGGILVTQNGVAFMQTDEVATTAQRFQPLFADWHFYTAAVPTYVGGAMAFAWGTDNRDLRRLPREVLAARFQNARLQTRYYTPSVHAASFALPQYLLAAIGKQDGD